MPERHHAVWDVKQTLCEIIGVLRSLRRTMFRKIVGQDAEH